MKKEYQNPIIDSIEVLLERGFAISGNSTISSLEEDLNDYGSQFN